MTVSCLASDQMRGVVRAIIMPNLKPPVVNTKLALAYRDRILKALPKGRAFKPLMTLYLTDKTTANVQKHLCVLPPLFSSSLLHS